MTSRRAVRPELFWPALVVGLLLVPIVAGGFLVAASTGDPSFAVERNYHAKALAWDADRAQARASAELGWRGAVSALPAPGRGGELSVGLALADAAGAPLSGATVEVEAFHVARAAEILATELRPLGPGLYAATLPSDRPGLWELRFEARRDGAVFVQTSRLDVPARAGTP